MALRPPLIAIALLSLSIPAAPLRAEVARKTPKVVLVSLDGAADWLVDDFLARGVLPPDGAFARMARQGTRAEAMVPVDDSLTAVAHAAMFTGTFPDRTGIVSNQFLPSGGAIFPPLNGFDAPILAETLWSAARRQGKRVVCIATPAADAASPDRTCGLTLAHGRTIGRARRLDLTPAAGTGSAGGPSFEHARALGARGTGSEGAASLDYRFTDGNTVPLHAFAVDTAFDGRERYDAVVLDFDADLSNGYAARIRRSEWTRLSVPAREKGVGAWVKLIELAEDLSAVTVYLGVPAQNHGAPAAFVDEITERFGPWPGAPEAGPRSDGSIDETLWREQAARQNGFLEGIAEHALRRDDWDLMTVYLPLLDEAGHLFLLRDPRQLDYGSEDGELRERYAGRVEWAYAAADSALRRWMAAAPPETNFVVVSDHGMVPVYAEVLLNVILARAGLRVTQDRTTEVRAFGTGGTGQVHVNVAGRQEGGVVPAAKLDEYVQRIVDACKDVREPFTGEPAFAAVLKRSELGRLRLGHTRNSPDVWVSARPGLTVRSVMGVQQPVFRPLRAGGQHGYLGSNREVQAIFFAAGPDIPPAYIRPVRQIDVAATVAALLGIEPPADNEGRTVLKPESH